MAYRKSIWRHKILFIQITLAYSLPRSSKFNTLILSCLLNEWTSLCTSLVDENVMKTCERNYTSDERYVVVGLGPGSGRPHRPVIRVGLRSRTRRQICEEKLVEIDALSVNILRTHKFVKCGKCQCCKRIKIFCQVINKPTFLKDVKEVAASYTKTYLILIL